MLTAIDLDYQRRLQAREVHDEGADRMLASEFQVAALADPQVTPERVFCGCHRASEAFGKQGASSVAHWVVQN